MAMKKIIKVKDTTSIKVRDESDIYGSNTGGWNGLTKVYLDECLHDRTEQIVGEYGFVTYEYCLNSECIYSREPLEIYESSDDADLSDDYQEMINSRGY